MVGRPPLEVSKLRRAHLDVGSGRRPVVLRLDARAAGLVHSCVCGVQIGGNVEDVGAGPQGEPARVATIVIAEFERAHRFIIVELRVIGGRSRVGG